jgi:hypothetical protein
MKISGKRLDMPPVVIVPVLRGETETIFKVGAVLDFKEFELLCPAPIPPMIKHKDAVEPVPDLKDKKYIDACDKYARQRSSYMIIKSISHTENLEWESVDLGKPETYSNYEKELKDAGLNQIEIGRLIGAVMEANGLDETKIEEARKRFLALKVVQA